MPLNNPLIDDFGRVANGALGALSGLRGEIEARVRQHVERLVGSLDMVTREEFEIVSALARRARAEQEALEERVRILETRLAELTQSRS
ncbi:accessory factor UbiK family protein [Phaeospirillum tilakii]|uniref:Accessory factor UbiK family protein n=1 Tax=Phaeospirillum tilakii TaxID=741673 RepID=A0ABW5C5H8_9PROT